MHFTPSKCSNSGAHGGKLFEDYKKLLFYMGSVVIDAIQSYSWVGKVESQPLGHYSVWVSTNR